MDKTQVAPIQLSNPASLDIIMPPPVDLSKNKTARILADAEKGGYGVIAAIV